jgi:hypothetical protein
MVGTETLVSTFQRRDNLDEDDELREINRGGDDDIDDLKRE